MFDNNFNPETSLKKWAQIFRALSLCLMGLSFLAAIIVLGIDAEYLWWISLIILGSGGLIMLATYLSTAILWAFGDMVGNTRRIAYGSAAQPSGNDDVLPEL